MSSIKNISLYIPHVFSNYEKEDIKNVFEKLKIGNVKNIDLISKMGKDGKTFNTAYIHFNYWYDTKEATELQENIFNSNKDARLVYDNPWFWIVLENKAKKFISGERKTRINLGDLLKQETQPEKQETQPEEQEPKKQEPEKKKEQKIQTTQYLPIAPTLNNEEFSFEEIEEIENQILMDELEDEMDDDSFYDDYDSMHEQWKEEASRKYEKKSPSGKPKTAKQLEREAKRMTNAQKMSKSVKEVYTALVKAFHPDREMDETEKLRKTAIVQEVISAYEKNDLLTLLQLQLQFEQIDQSHLNNVAEEQLKYYTKILLKQSNQIQQELQAIEQQLRQYFSIPANQKISPVILDGMIVKDIKNIKKSIHSVRENLKLLQDTNYLQAYINHYEISDDDY